MKKFLAIALIAASFTACNNGEDKKVDEVKTSDTTTVVVPVAPDTMNVVKDTTVKTTVTVDTMKKKGDN